MLKGDVNYDDFTYIIQKHPPAKICFGASVPRKIITSKYKSNNKGPAYYFPKYEFDKVQSKRGTAGISNLAKRVTIDISNVVSPDPCKYAIVKPKELTQNCAPFNSKSRRKSIIIPNKNPSPATYKVSYKFCKRTRIDYNLGKPCIVPAVETICINYPNNWCQKCGEAFEYGDFWHRNYQDYLCTLCMDEEHQLHELYKEKELCTFKKIRTCTFMHRHEGTSAAIRLMSDSKIKKLQRIENYLSLFNKCYGTKSQTELNLPLNERI